MRTVLMKKRLLCNSNKCYLRMEALFLVPLCCGAIPEGQSFWTMSLSIGISSLPFHTS